jgi:hypothetical protein
VNKRALEEQESVRWVDGYQRVDELTHVADREADIHDLLVDQPARRHPRAGPGGDPMVPVPVANRGVLQNPQARVPDREAATGKTRTPGTHYPRKSSSPRRTRRNTKKIKVTLKPVAAIVFTQTVTARSPIAH